MHQIIYILGLSLLLCLGCDPVGPDGDFPLMTATPDLQFGKGDDGSSNTILGDRLHPGSALNGSHWGYVAMPLEAEQGTPIKIHAWTSRPSVIFLYGPKAYDGWTLEQAREFSQQVKPGIEFRSLNFDIPETGEYLVIIGSTDEEPTEWIVARAAPEIR